MADAFLPASARSFDAGFVKLRRDLHKIRKSSRDALARAEKTTQALERGIGPERQVDLLRELHRAQKRLSRSIGRTTVLDALVQPELHHAGSIVHKAAAAEPTPGEVVEDCSRMIRATKAGLDRAKELVDRLEAEIGQTR